MDRIHFRGEPFKFWMDEKFLLLYMRSNKTMVKINVNEEGDESCSSEKEDGGDPREEACATRFVQKYLD